MERRCFCSLNSGDVYKRQAFTVVFFLTLANCFKLLDQNIALTDGAFGTRMLATQILRTIKDTTPVSYTHLDVYKRQEHTD